MAYIFENQVYFQDTDAAGVVYFVNVLNFCHAAYEKSLVDFGIPIRSFFAANSLIFPIAEAQIDFRLPMFCGDPYRVLLTAESISETQFVNHYQVFLIRDPQRLVSQAKTRHVCLERDSRQQQALPIHLKDWIQSTQQATTQSTAADGDD
ncbi:MAG: thioesterase family protein [Cyanobacteriota bacterium]|nr:thioesterase family protein [Cyanobacteriota bacterium]